MILILYLYGIIHKIVMNNKTFVIYLKVCLPKPVIFFLICPDLFGLTSLTRQAVNLIN
jgi:hypothetical protein